MDIPTRLLRNAVPGIVWPAVPGPAGARLLALQNWLDESQWLATAELERLQARQLARVLRHAYANVPFWRNRLDSAGYEPDREPTLAWFRSLPLLSRRDIQTHGDGLLSPAVPAGHGRPERGRTSGSTGTPITFYRTGHSRLFWLACTLREHLWHRRDLSGTLAAIRIQVERETVAGWGPATDLAFRTGACFLLNIRTDLDEQLDWLAVHEPDYLITHPSNLRALLRRSRERGWRPKRLREARTFAEALPDDLRALCREAWNARLCDAYSAEETGYIALQCPDREHYHVQSENLMVEILNSKGEPCTAGEIGRVVVTTLRNFAMPLFRYEIGDYAVAGAPCSCGRGLPVISQVLGRYRNLLRLPDGRRFFPSFPADDWAAIAPVRQLQVVQLALEDIAVHYIAERPLTADEETQLAAVFRRTLAYPFRIGFQRVSQFSRAANAKFQDFVSELDD